MPRYFFDVHDGLFVKDDVGQALSDLEAARQEAMQIASGYATNTKMLGQRGGAIIVVVRNDYNDELLDVRMVFSVDIRFHV